MQGVGWPLHPARELLPSKIPYLKNDKPQPSCQETLKDSERLLLKRGSHMPILEMRKLRNPPLVTQVRQVQDLAQAVWLQHDGSTASSTSTEQGAGGCGKKKTLFLEAERRQVRQKCIYTFLSSGMKNWKLSGEMHSLLWFMVCSISEQTCFTVVSVLKCLIKNILLLSNSGLRRDSFE